MLIRIPRIQIFVNRINVNNIINFKITVGHILHVLIPETTKIRGGTEKNINKNKIRDHVPNLGIVEVMLVHYHIFKKKKTYHHNSRVLVTLVPKYYLDNQFIFPHKV